MVGSFGVGVSFGRVGVSVFISVVGIVSGRVVGGVYVGLGVGGVSGRGSRSIGGGVKSGGVGEVKERFGGEIFGDGELYFVVGVGVMEVVLESGDFVEEFVVVDFLLIIFGVGDGGFGFILVRVGSGLISFGNLDRFVINSGSNGIVGVVEKFV